MSDLFPRRALFLTFATMLLTTAAFAAVVPTARYDARMVYDPVSTHSILFGGTTAVDQATKQSYELNDTWDWNGALWTQLFPLHMPTARYGHVMVYDSARKRIVLFGGRGGNNTTDLNDTWIYQNGDWSQLNPPNAPPARVLAGGAYDPLRDRVVVFGGSQISSDNKTVTAIHDTWEFDGTTWKQVLADGPKADKPIMIWDAARAAVFMLGVDSTIASHQYYYDPNAAVWNENTKTRLPSCVQEGALTYQENSGSVFFTGGSCSGVGSTEDNEEWDGNQWNPKFTATSVGRVFGQAMVYDAARQQTVLFGGTPVLSSAPRFQTWVYNGDWDNVEVPNLAPSARSLFTFRSDPDTNAIYLYGGVDGTTNYAEIWKYQYGKWARLSTDTPPPQLCSSPTSAYDTNRKKLVVLCADSTIFYEFDASIPDWKAITNLSKAPQGRNFSSMAYDESLKKSVLFGGYTTDYINQTWTWDGTSWTEVEHDRPPQRILPAMWYDPHLKKTVIFGGLGRADSNATSLTRFSDMWSFDGTNWSEIKPAHVPPARYGAQVAVNPNTGNVLLFGGLRVDTVPSTDSNGQPTTKQVQVYADDFWQWDGTDWTQQTFARTPYARENGGLAWDPSTQQFVIFGGYAGQQYLSDLWTLTPDKGWQPQLTNVTRRRSTGRP